MDSLNKTLDIATKINENLGQQTEQLENIDKQSDGINKSNTETKKKLQIMDSYFYSIYYWIESFFLLDKEIEKHTDQKGKYLVQVDQNQNNMISQLEQLEKMSLTMGEEIHYQNNLLDKIEDKNIKNTENLKKNNRRIDKL